MTPGHQPDIMLEAFKDPAVPDGAHSMSTSALDTELYGGGDELQTGTQVWYGICEECKSNSVSGGQFGPNRTSREQAAGDVAAHKQANPEHNPMVYP